ncbi:hypothetical protein DICVIV_05331 [Dictyocaulus viviparus]|uniref:Protein sleepless n=1 Tax=Dictyocaulus viviparus TaxID=29172 RepID=A0A0D8XVK1_DICVI|nr:hypothetical protein DICVIV_05331 [Dictyocaulus viviparus]
MSSSTRQSARTVLNSYKNKEETEIQTNKISFLKAGSMMNAPAQCTNTSQAGRESMICCCYGDGCNSASVTTTWLTMISVVGLSIGPAFLV